MRTFILLLLNGLFLIAQGWQKSLPLVRPTSSCLTLRSYCKSPIFCKASPSVSALFGAHSMTNSASKPSLLETISLPLRKLRQFLQVIIRRVVSVVMITSLVFSMIFQVSSPAMARPQQSQPQPQVHMVAANKPTTTTTSTARQRELLQKARSQKKRKLQSSVKSQPSSKQSSKQQQPPATTVKPAKPTTPAKVPPAASKQQPQPQKASDSPLQSPSALKQLYDKIGLAAVVVSLVSIFVRFNNNHNSSNSHEVKSLLSELKDKQKKTSTQPIEDRVIPQIPSSQSVMKKKVSQEKKDRGDEEEEDEAEDEYEDDKRDDTFINREQQKTLSVRDYLQNKKPTASSPITTTTTTTTTTRSTAVSSLARKAAETVKAKPEEEEEVLPDIPLPYATVMAAPEESILPEDSLSSSTITSEISSITTKEKAMEAARALREASHHPPPSPPSTSTATTSHSPVKKKSKSFISRLFSKPGGGRPSDLSAALRRDKDGTTPLRVAIGTGLLQFVPEDLGRKMGQNYPALLASFLPNSNEDVLTRIASLSQESGLSPEETAEIFAEVTNAFVVQLVDRAAEALVEVKDKKSDDSHSQKKQMKVVINRLDDLTTFMAGVTPLFLAVIQTNQSQQPTAEIEPLQYNGKTAKGKLELLFEEYLRDVQLVESQSLMSTSSTSDNEIPVDSQELQDRQDRLAKLQYLLGIKENKRSSIESKLMREQMSAMFGGQAGEKGTAGGLGGGGLGELLSGFNKGGVTGGGGLGGMPAGMNPKEMEALMKEMQANPEKFEEAMKAMKDLDPKLMKDLQTEGMMPDLSKMKPEEVNEMIRQQVSYLQERMKSGDITLQEIVEVEQSLGMPLEGFLSAVNSKEVRDMTKAGGLPLGNVIETFEELANVKRQLQSQS